MRRLWFYTPITLHWSDTTNDCAFTYLLHFSEVIVQETVHWKTGKSETSSHNWHDPNLIALRSRHFWDTSCSSCKRLLVKRRLQHLNTYFLSLPIPVACRSYITLSQLVVQSYLKAMCCNWNCLHLLQHTLKHTRCKIIFYFELFS